jgi:hypothetical protein
VSSPGSFAGWDVFLAPNDGVMRVARRADWIVLTLARPAQLAVVWRDGATPPSWLQGWSAAAPIVVNGTSQRTFTRSFPAGTVTLGGLFNPTETNYPPRTAYWVLFAEASGQPSPPPAVPGGLEVPRANQTCPGWVHDRYVTTAPDGRSYPTWHPQIDPVYWCYFRHEHGSDPSLVGGGIKPAYGYTSSAAGVDETHQGFKSYVFDDPQGHRWLLSHHFGTGSVNRACARFHGLDIVVATGAGGQVLADMHLLADFGAAVVNTTGAPITPSACPDQYAQANAESSDGVRRLPVGTFDGGVPYEPWRADTGGNIVGFRSAALTFNTPDGVLICADITCNQGLRRAAFGTRRFFLQSQGFGVVAGANTGEFYTDPRGRTRVSAGQPGAVRQYVRPGTAITLPSTNGHCRASDSWRAMYLCSEAIVPQLPIDLEGALLSPN